VQGIHHWTAAHPDWNERQDWPQQVSSYALETGAGLVLIDPLETPAELRGRALAVVLTCPWHQREAQSLGLPVHVPAPDEGVPGQTYSAGDTLPFGIAAIEGFEPNDVLLWVPELAALVAGDTLIDRGDGLIFPRDWAERAGDADALLARIRAEVLALPVEVVLPTHGAPADRAALERALAQV
jgi:hypothetical protein